MTLDDYDRYILVDHIFFTTPILALHDVITHMTGAFLTQNRLFLTEGVEAGCDTNSVQFQWNSHQRNCEYHEGANIFEGDDVKLHSDCSGATAAY
jgi:hypothetical protein